VLLRHVQLALLLEPRASVPLTQGLELRPVCVELLRETPLRWDGARRSRLLVLGAGRRRKSILPPLVCLMEAVELWKDKGARTDVLGASGRRHPRLVVHCSRTSGGAFMASSHLTKPTGAVTKPTGAVTRQMPQHTPTTGEKDESDVSDEASSGAAIGNPRAPAARTMGRPGSGYAALARVDDAEMPTLQTPYTSSSPKARAQAASCHWKQQPCYATPPRLPPPRSLGDDPDPDYSPSRPGVMVAPLPVTPSARRSTRGQLPPEPRPCARPVGNHHAVM
jgi:hypothetical protein